MNAQALSSAQLAALGRITRHAKPVETDREPIGDRIGRWLGNAQLSGVRANDIRRGVLLAYELQKATEDAELQRLLEAPQEPAAAPKRGK